MIIWVIGMSAAGKTTIATEMVKLLDGPRADKKWILVDGDDLRAIWGSSLGHSVEERRENSRRMQALCLLLDEAGINVVAPILSIAPDHRRENRSIFSDYRELYVECSYEVLKRRDNKDLYERAERGEIDDVVGVQIEFPEPESPDRVVDNSVDGVPPVEVALTALEGLGIDLDLRYRYSEVDRLSSPTKYEYTRFEGSRFLRAYEEHRINVCTEVEADLRRIHIGSYSKSGAEPSPLSARLLRSLPSEFRTSPWRVMLDEALGEVTEEVGSGDSRFFTVPFLVSRLTAIGDGGFGWKDDRATILRLLQRFEVSKKVDVEYSWPDLRRTTRDSSTLLNFPLFSILLSALIDVVDPATAAIMTNSILKLGDIISSAHRRFVTTPEKLLVLSSICEELQILGSRDDDA